MRFQNCMLIEEFRRKRSHTNMINLKKYFLLIQICLFIKEFIQSRIHLSIMHIKKRFNWISNFHAHEESTQRSNLMSVRHVKKGLLLMQLSMQGRTNGIYSGSTRIWDSLTGLLPQSEKDELNVFQNPHRQGNKRTDARAQWERQKHTCTKTGKRTARHMGTERDRDRNTNTNTRRPKQANR